MKISLAQLNKLNAKHVLMNSLMARAKRVNHNFYSYRFHRVDSEHHLEVSPDYETTLFPAYPTTWLAGILGAKKLSFSARHSDVPHVDKKASTGLEENKKSDKNFFIFRNAKNLFYIDFSPVAQSAVENGLQCQEENKIPEHVLRDVLEKHYFCLHVRTPVIKLLNRQFSQGTVIENFDANMNALYDAWNLSENRSLEWLKNNIKNKFKISQDLDDTDVSAIGEGLLALKKENEQLSKDGETALFRKLEDAMNVAEISDYGWADWKTIQKIECPRTQTFWMGIMLIADLGSYNTIDAINLFDDVPGLVLALQLLMSAGFTAHYLSREYRNMQGDTYLKDPKLHGLQEQTIINAIEKESYLLAVQAAVVAMFSSLLCNHELVKMPSIEGVDDSLSSGILSAAILSAALLLVTMSINRYYNKEHQFKTGHYVAVAVLGALAGATFSSLMMLPGPHDQNIWYADLAILNAQRIAALVFGAGLYAVLSRGSKVKSPVLLGNHLSRNSMFASTSNEERKNTSPQG